MPVPAQSVSTQSCLAQLRTELADLAYDLERQGRRDAADVVMMLDARVRELVEEARTVEPTIPALVSHSLGDG